MSSIKYFFTASFFFLLTNLISQVNPGNALQFDGVDDHVTLPSFQQVINGSFTIEFWYYPEAGITNDQYLVGNRGSGQSGTGGNWFLINSNLNDKLFVQVGRGDKDYYTLLSTDFQNNEWMHIALTREVVGESEVVTLYINGIQHDKKVSGYRSWSINQLMYIGCHPVYSGKIKGKVDEFRIWSHARTHKQLKETLNSPLSGNDDGLTCYFNFNQSSGNTVLDMSESPFYDVTLNNMSSSS